jgi:hypothetical protein
MWKTDHRNAYPHAMDFHAAMNFMPTTPPNLCS